MKDPVRIKKYYKMTASRITRGATFQFFKVCAGTRKDWFPRYKQNEVGFRIVRNP